MPTVVLPQPEGPYKALTPRVGSARSTSSVKPSRGRRSVAQIADRLIEYAGATGADGFNLSRTVFPECLVEVVDQLVPALQERGAYKRAYAPGTYREKLYGAGTRLLERVYAGSEAFLQCAAQCIELR